MGYPCPVCGSDTQTFPHPKHHKQYTERGRLDIDDWYCHACKSRWEGWHYIKEGTEEIKNIRVRDGRPWVEGQAQGDPILCHCCGSDDVTFEQDDGPWRNQYDVRQLRYECAQCGGMWQHMTQADGEVLASRIWRRGKVPR